MKTLGNLALGLLGLGLSIMGQPLMWATLIVRGTS